MTNTGADASPGGAPLRSGWRGRRADLLAAACGALLVLAAGVVGYGIQQDVIGSGELYVEVPAPLYGPWLPHVGPGTPLALAVAAIVVLHGPAAARRLPWRGALAAVWAAAMAWLWSLALIDGWQRGVAGRLETRHEYLTVIDRFGDVGAALSGYTRHILMDAPDNWPAHVAGHPPAAILTFVGLDRVGLGGGAWAAVWCITIGAAAAPAIMVALRAFGAEDAARSAAPFLVLAPAAVWGGVSADGYFAAVAAWGLALLALAAARTVRFPAAAAVGAGLLLGWTVYLSYGLVLLGLPAVAVLLLARDLRPLLPALLAALAVAGAFTWAGFAWWEGYDLLVVRYYQGAAADRPYSYWVWANLANVVLAAGLASVAGLRRVAIGASGAVRRWRSAALTGHDAVVVLVLAMTAALLVADVSGMSKAETERIWLPFVLWLLPAAALLPHRDHRWWLLAQAALALAVNHLLLTGW